MINRPLLYLISISFAVLTSSGCNFTSKQQQKPSTNNHTSKETDTVRAAFRINILDDRALEIIDPKSEIEILANGFTWTEGPLWVDEGQYLLFSDIPNNKIYKLDYQSKAVTTYLEPSGYTGEPTENGAEPGSNGLILDGDNNLILMQHGDRRVAKMNAPLNAPKAAYETLMDNYQGKRLNSPNDATFDSHGNLYFTDPPYGLPKLMDDPDKQLDFQGVYCLKKDGVLVLLDKLTRPNGIALSTDESSLFVANSDPENSVWYQYKLDTPEKVSDKKIFYDVNHLVGKEEHSGLPDGMESHSKGFLFATGPGGLWIFNENAEVLARIFTGQLTSNCAISTDEKKLFMTADDYILAIDLK